MKKYILGTWVMLGLSLLSGCNRKIAPTIIYQDKIVTKTDTVTVVSKQTDTIPCDDFQTFIEGEKDTVFVQVVKNVLTVKTVVKRDTVYRETIIVQPAPIRSVTKIDNSVHNKAKNSSAIGDGNKITTKNLSWWWIFFAGMLTMFVLQNVVWRVAKRYIPILNFTA